MRNWVSTLAGGAAFAALATGSAFAQDEASAPQTIAPASDEAATDAEPELVSEAVVQGGGEATVEPYNPSWGTLQVADLIKVIESIDKEGLDPADYDLQALKVSLASGPSEELTALATKNFTWLVEDLRDGRTPQSARKQWFVEDPDRNLFRTVDMLKKALGDDGVEAALMSLNPSHPDYARLREELANTPATQTKKRKLIRANMDRWRWLGRDLGTTYLITNVPE